MKFKTPDVHGALQGLSIFKKQTVSRQRWNFRKPGYQIRHTAAAPGATTTTPTQSFRWRSISFFSFSLICPHVWTHQLQTKTTSSKMVKIKQLYKPSADGLQSNQQAPPLSDLILKYFSYFSCADFFLITYLTPQRMSLLLAAELFPIVNDVINDTTVLVG